MVIRLCTICHTNAATKRHISGNFYYCDQCAWESGWKDFVGINDKPPIQP